MTDIPLPEETAHAIACDASIEDPRAYRLLFALLIEQLGFLGNVLISIDEKLEGTPPGVVKH